MENTRPAEGPIDPDRKSKSTKPKMPSKTLIRSTIQAIRELQLPVGGVRIYADGRLEVVTHPIDASGEPTSSDADGWL